MKIGVEISIDVTKLDKSRFYKGKKGTYATLTAFIDIENTDQYDQNGFITQKRTKEEDESKTQLPILGNSKVFWSNGQQSAPQQTAPSPPQAPSAPVPQQAPANNFDDFDEDIPF